MPPSPSLHRRSWCPAPLPRSERPTYLKACNALDSLTLWIVSACSWLQETTASSPCGRSILPDSCTILPTAAVAVRHMLDLERGRTGPVEGVSHPQYGRGPDAYIPAGRLDPVFADDHRTSGVDNRADAGGHRTGHEADRAERSHFCVQRGSVRHYVARAAGGRTHHAGQRARAVPGLRPEATPGENRGIAARDDAGAVSSAWSSRRLARRGRCQPSVPGTS